MPKSHSVTGMLLGFVILGVLAAAAAAGTPGGATQPPSGAVTISANPTTVVFGRTTAISGQVTGQKAAGADVTLEHTPAPFTAPFTKAGVQGTADAAGNYTLTAAPTVNTRYRVTAKTSPPSTSPSVQVNVRPLVTLRLSDTSIRRPRRIRFSGVVRPAHDGATARIQRRTRTGKYRTVATVELTRSATAGESVYARRLRVRRTSRFRVVLPAHTDHVTGRSGARRVRVG